MKSGKYILLLLKEYPDNTSIIPNELNSHGSNKVNIPYLNFTNKL